MKRYEFELDDRLYNLAAEPIRNKNDIIRLLVETTKFLINSPINSLLCIRRDRKLILYVDKMSRVIFSLPNKIFSFQFPFSIKSSLLRNNLLKINSCSGLDIDSSITSALINIFKQNDVTSDNFIEGLLCKVWEVIDENGWKGMIDDGDLCNIIRELLMFEPGYFRYDHDEARKNGRVHSNNKIWKLESKWMFYKSCFRSDKRKSCQC